MISRRYLAALWAITALFASQETLAQAAVAPSAATTAGRAAAVAGTGAAVKVGKTIVKHPFLSMGVAAVGITAVGIGGEVVKDCNRRMSEGDIDYSNPKDVCVKLANANRTREDLKEDPAGLAEYATLYKATRELRKNMAAAGQPAKKRCAAHHIVPQGENRDWAKKYVDNARNILRQCQIDIDDADNGVYLPFFKDSQCEGNNHRTLHTQKYYLTVAQALNSVFPEGCASVRNMLRQMKQLLEQNRFPY